MGMMTDSVFERELKGELYVIVVYPNGYSESKNGLYVRKDQPIRDNSRLEVTDKLTDARLFQKRSQAIKSATSLSKNKNNTIFTVERVLLQVVLGREVDRDGLF